LSLGLLHPASFSELLAHRALWIRRLVIPEGQVGRKAGSGDCRSSC
jgi:hypothetical protein